MQYTPEGNNTGTHELTQNYYQHIRQQYGEQIATVMKEYSKEGEKLCSTLASRNFLLTCRNYTIIPSFIKNSTTNTKVIITTLNQGININYYNRIEKFFHQKLLNLLISTKCKHVKQLNETQLAKKSFIEAVISLNDSQLFLTSQKTANNKRILNLSQENEKKILKLKTNLFTELGMDLNSNAFENRTQIQFPKETEWLLSLGEKFALPFQHTDFPMLQMIADGEHAIQHISDHEKQNLVRTNFISHIGKHINTRKTKDQKEKVLLTIFNNTKKFLNEHKDILVISADKGNKTVVLKKQEYLEKMKDLVNTRDTYRIIRRDPTTTLQTKNNNLVQQLRNYEHINDIQKYKMTTHNSIFPRMYGHPKIHKENCPMRPIVSTINSPCYYLSQYIGDILKNLTLQSEYNIKNSKQFIDKIINLNITDQDILTSFDAKSLFTSIPITLTLKIIDEKWHKLTNFTTIPKEMFIRLLKFCIIECNYFSLNNQLYRQIAGLPMGSPLAPILADIVMEELLDNTLKPDNNIKLVTKYVDDLFCVVPKTRINSTLEKLNSWHPNLQFTAEIEKDQKIPYLDVLVIRDHNRLITDWYRKDISSSRIINFLSTHPPQQIINTAKNLISKILDISHIKFHPQNINKIKDILKQNNFPIHQINTLVQQYFKQKNSTQNRLKTVETNKQYFSTQYVPNLTNKLQRLITDHDNKILLASRISNNLKNKNCFSHTKDKIPTLNKSNVVYKISCSGNADNPCNLNYVGTTKSYLKTRLLAHKSDHKLKNVNATALSQHCCKTGHILDTKHTKILHIEKNYKKRLILESLHINQTKNTMNFKTDTNNIDQYKGVIGTAKEKWRS